MSKEELREELISIIETCRNCVDFVDEDSEEHDPYLAYKIALRLSIVDIKLMKLAKTLKWGIR